VSVYIIEWKQQVFSASATHRETAADESDDVIKNLYSDY